MTKKKTDAPAPTAGDAQNGSEAPAPAPAAPAKQPAAARPPLHASGRATLRSQKPGAPALVAVLASATGTSPLVLAAIKAAYGWTDKTRLTRPEFLRRRDEWLARPASEV